MSFMDKLRKMQAQGGQSSENGGSNPKQAIAPQVAQPVKQTVAQKAAAASKHPVVAAAPSVGQVAQKTPHPMVAQKVPAPPAGAANDDTSDSDDPSSSESDSFEYSGDLGIGAVASKSSMSCMVETRQPLQVEQSEVKDGFEPLDKRPFSENAHDDDMQKDPPASVAPAQGSILNQTPLVSGAFATKTPIPTIEVDGASDDMQVETVHAISAPDDEKSDPTEPINDGRQKGKLKWGKNLIPTKMNGDKFEFDDDKFSSAKYVKNYQIVMLKMKELQKKHKTQFMVRVDGQQLSKTTAHRSGYDKRPWRLQYSNLTILEIKYCHGPSAFVCAIKGTPAKKSFRIVHPKSSHGMAMRFVYSKDYAGCFIKKEVTHSTEMKKGFAGAEGVPSEFSWSDEWENMLIDGYMHMKRFSENPHSIDTPYSEYDTLLDTNAMRTEEEEMQKRLLQTPKKPLESEVMQKEIENIVEKHSEKTPKKKRKKRKRSKESSEDDAENSAKKRLRFDEPVESAPANDDGDSMHIDIPVQPLQQPVGPHAGGALSPSERLEQLVDQMFGAPYDRVIRVLEGRGYELHRIRTSK